jgi:RNA polymerase sigma factor (TIGR02999 family)
MNNGDEFMEPSAGRDPDRVQTDFSLTHLLTAAHEGDTQAFASVYDRTYEELRELASLYMRSVPSTDTLQPTALVNEAYLRICGRADLSPVNTREFFGIVSRAMRDILVEQARKHGAQKRGAGWTRVMLEMDHIENRPASIEVGPIQLSEALEELRRVEPDIEELIRLRFFAGLSLRAAAQLMEVPFSRVRHDWDYARAWLKSRLAADIIEQDRDE